MHAAVVIDIEKLICGFEKNDINIIINADNFDFLGVSINVIATSSILEPKKYKKKLIAVIICLPPDHSYIQEKP